MEGRGKKRVGKREKKGRRKERKLLGFIMVGEACFSAYHTQKHTYMHTDPHLPSPIIIKHSLVPKETAFRNFPINCFQQPSPSGKRRGYCRK